MKTLNHTKLHELLSLALDDLAKAEQSPDCVVNMEYWRNRTQSGRCLVCLAGAVMQFSLEDAEADSAWDYDEDTRPRLEALNCLRLGCVSDAVRCLKGDHEAARRLSRDITRYKQDRSAWWAEMRQLLADLQAEDL